MAELPIILNDEKDQVDKYSQKELDKVLRPHMVDMALMPIGDLIALSSNPEEFNKLSAFQGTWAKILLRGALKGDIMPAVFMQEHLVGKAIQRIHSETMTFTYQDLLHKIKTNEAKFQVVAGETLDAEVVEPKQKTWADLL